MIAVNIMIYENSIKRFFSMSVTCIFSTRCSLYLNSLKNLMNSVEKYFFAMLELFSFLKDSVIFFGKLINKPIGVNNQREVMSAIGIISQN